MLQAGAVKRVEHAHQARTWLHQAELIGSWAFDLENQIAAKSTRGVGNLHAKGGIGRIAGAGGHTSASLQVNAVPKCQQFLGCLWT